MKIQGTFNVQSWDEKPVQQFADGCKLTRATVVQTYMGVMQGTSSVEYTMYYPSPTSSTFIGIESFEGSIAGKAGRVFFKHEGKFENGVASSQFSAIGGSAELAHIACHGRFATVSHTAAEYSLEVD